MGPAPFFSPSSSSKLHRVHLRFCLGPCFQPNERPNARDIAVIPSLPLCHGLYHPTNNACALLSNVLSLFLRLFLRTRIAWALLGSVCRVQSSGLTSPL